MICIYVCCVSCAVGSLSAASGDSNPLCLQAQGVVFCWVQPVMSPGALRTKMGIFPCVLTPELCELWLF